LVGHAEDSVTVKQEPAAVKKEEPVTIKEEPTDPFLVTGTGLMYGDPELYDLSVLA
jgi:hypothetical protein